MKMRIILGLLFLFGILFSSSASAGFFDSFLNNGVPEIRYCNGGECSLSGGIDLVKDRLNGIETTQSASQYIQSIVLYILSFISLLAILYIIYAGFQILTGNGDEEKLKSSKQTIIYVIIGITLIWLSWPITRFIFQMFN